MPFTKIDLAPALNPLFDKCRKQLDTLDEAEKHVQAVRKTLDALTAEIDIHSKKLTEAKARK